MEFNFQIINKRSQLTNLINVTAKTQDSSDSTSGSGTFQALVSKIHNDFANCKAIRQEQNKHIIKVLDINSANVTTAMLRYGTVESCQLYMKNTWQQAFILFKKKDSVNKFYDN